MNTNDKLLQHMIHQDMQDKGITDYHLTDEVIENPDKIDVGANQVAYICYLSIKESSGFAVEVESATGKVIYSPANTKVHLRDTIGNTHSSKTYNYRESSLISRHWSNATVKKTGDVNDFFIRLIRVQYTKISNT